MTLLLEMFMNIPFYIGNSKAKHIKDYLWPRDLLQHSNKNTVINIPMKNFDLLVIGVYLDSQHVIASQFFVCFSF